MRNAVIAIVIVVILGIGGWLIFGNKNNSTTNNSTQSSSNTNSQSPISTNSVTIQNLTFTPASITVKKGTTVTWTNKDSTAHTVTADSGNGPASQPLQPGARYSFTYNQAGTFAYHCLIHPEMHGSVTVTDTSSAAPSNSNSSTTNSSTSSNPY